MKKFNGLVTDLGSLTKLSDAKSRSLSPENYTGAKGKGGMAKIGEGFASEAARELGVGWKVNPFHIIKAGETFELLDSGTHWMVYLPVITETAYLRSEIIRCDYDFETAKNPARLVTHGSVPVFILVSYQPIFVTVSMVKY